MISRSGSVWPRRNGISISSPRLLFPVPAPVLHRRCPQVGAFSNTLRCQDTVSAAARLYYSSSRRLTKATYKDALAYLNTLQTPFDILARRRRSPKPDLRKNNALIEMYEWVNDIGYKAHDFDRLNVIHVAGTKGKGSTCGFVNSILAQYSAKYNKPSKVGLYTSPHILSVRERIRINSEPISEDKFTQYFFEVWERLDNAATSTPRPKPPYFRYLTLLSLHAFMRENVDVAIYEVGVGGEFDSTNVFTKPIATGITSLAIDHVVSLGSTIEDIAWHKAGIMKPGAPAYTVAQPENAIRVLQQRAAERRVQLKVVPVGRCMRDIRIRPYADFQRGNASLAAVLASEALTALGIHAPAEEIRPHRLTGPKDNCVSLDWSLPKLFEAGLLSSVNRGRSEIVETDYGTWCLDGAHTIESLQFASDWFGQTLQSAASATGQQPLCILVFNQETVDRDARLLIGTVQGSLLQTWGIRPELAIFCTNVTFRHQKYDLEFVDASTDPNAARNLTYQHQYARWWGQGHSQGLKQVVPSIEEAVDAVRHYSRINAGRSVYVFATGSFRLVGSILLVLQGAEAIK